MQTFTLGFGVWFHRLVSRSPLVRSTDRVEATATALIVCVGVLAVPVAGAVGTGEYDRLANYFAAERLTYREVYATAVGDSEVMPEPYDASYRTEVGWTVDGVAHTAEIETSRMVGGDRLTIWVDSSGVQPRKVHTEEDAAAQAVATALGVWFAVVGLGAAAWLLLRLRLDRARSATWDRDLRDLADDGGRSNNTT